MGGGIRRREFIWGAAATGGALLGPAWLRDALAAPAAAGPGPYGPLSGPNEWGMLLPAGFTGRQVARGASLVGGYPWHFASDGQATYRTAAGGFVLVSNSETPGILGGGASAIRFSPAGEIERAYRILALTNLNCAGGPTPWGTWLSGEEHPGGMIWEADPAGKLLAQPRPALGSFAHEAAAVDPVHKHVYLTEDESDGCFYRFTPDAYPSLLAGKLEAAAVAGDGQVTWHEVPDPNLIPGLKATRNQVPQATRFNGGEGLWYDDGTIYFTTKGDKRVWALDTAAQTLEILYDGNASPSALNAVDNVTVSASGDVYVCEDGGNMEVGVISPDQGVAAFCRLEGPDHEGSEITGVVFDPSGTRMYFGSQRAYPIVGGTPAALGAIYEVTGPFRLPPGGVPASKVYGPPAGEQGAGVIADPAHVSGLRLLGSSRRGAVLRAELELDAPARVALALRTAELETIHSPRWRERRPQLTLLGSRTAELGSGRQTVELPLTRALGTLPRSTLLATLRTEDGRHRAASLIV